MRVSVVWLEHRVLKYKRWATVEYVGHVYQHIISDHICKKAPNLGTAVGAALRHNLSLAVRRTSVYGATVMQVFIYVSCSAALKNSNHNSAKLRRPSL